MFEKEAEEYVKYWIVGEDDNALMQEAYKDGAEFGYQKGIKAKINITTISDYPVKGEWNFVKDKGLPKLHGWYWVQYINETFDCAILSTKQRFINFYTREDTTDSVLAWQKIVPPELPKEQI